MGFRVIYTMSFSSRGSNKDFAGLLHCLHCSYKNSAITGVIWIQPAKSLLHPLEVELPIKKSPQYAINILECSINIHHNNIYFLSRSLRKIATKNLLWSENHRRSFYQLAPIIEGIEFPLIFDSSLWGCYPWRGNFPRIP